MTDVPVLRQFLPVGVLNRDLRAASIPRVSKLITWSDHVRLGGIMRSWMIAIMAAGIGIHSVFAADPPTQPFWSGRLADKPQVTDAVADSKSAADKTARDDQKAKDAKPASREPEWLRRMDKNDRATLTGGWTLQNWSGGTQSQTSAGDKSGPFAPNTYQGGQFQPWNNVANRQDVASWNGPAPSFPRQMWSQGYVSPNTYYGTDAQLWGNMSSGTMRPNAVSGGWTFGR